MFEENEEEKKESPIDKVKKYWEIFQRKSTKKTIFRVKRSVLNILKHVLPQKVKIHGVIGLGDPSLTGRILGIFYMGYPKYSKYGDYRLAGDFEKINVKIKYMFKGRIRLGYLVFQALRLLIDKNIRHLIFHRKKKDK